MDEEYQIIKAWEIIDELTEDIKRGCEMEPEEIVNTRCLYYKCKEFIKAVNADKRY